MLPKTPVQDVHSYQENRVCMLYNLGFVDIDSNFGAKFDPEGPQGLSVVFCRLPPRAQAAPIAFTLWQTIYFPLYILEYIPTYYCFGASHVDGLWYCVF